MEKRFAVVTGASKGIGKELALCFAREGFDLIIAGRNQGHLGNVAHECKELGSEVVHQFIGDLTEDGKVEELVEQIKIMSRPVDAIAINAGRGVGGRFAETSLEEELFMMNLNVISTVKLAKLVLPDMVSRGEGKILFTGSVAGTLPTPYQAVYGATKAFVNNFSKALGYELKDTGVTTTVLMPDATETNFFATANLEDTKVGEAEKQDPALVAKEGFKALMAGRESVYGGDLMTKIQDRIVNSILPDKVKEAMIGEQSKPGSAKH